MATSLISDISDTSDEHSEVEGVVKLEPEESIMRSPLYIYTTEEDTDK